MQACCFAAGLGALVEKTPLVQNRKRPRSI